VKIKGERKTVDHLIMQDNCYIQLEVLSMEFQYGANSSPDILQSQYLKEITGMIVGYSGIPEDAILDL
jgi:hypothetical protein